MPQRRVCRPRHAGRAACRKGHRRQSCSCLLGPQSTCVWKPCLRCHGEVVMKLMLMLMLLKKGKKKKKNNNDDNEDVCASTTRTNSQYNMYRININTTDQIREDGATRTLTRQYTNGHTKYHHTVPISSHVCHQQPSTSCTGGNATHRQAQRRQAQRQQAAEQLKHIINIDEVSEHIPVLV